MLNIKYMVYGPQRDNIIPNPSANGNGWFVREVVPANTANEELGQSMRNKYAQYCCS